MCETICPSNLLSINSIWHYILLDFSLTVKAATLIFISGCGSAISSAKEGKSGFIYNLVNGLGAKSQILSSVAPPRKKKLGTIFSQGHVWGPQKPMFY